MQDICRRPVNASFVEIQSWYLIKPPPHKDGRLVKKLVRWPMLFFFAFFSPEHMYLSSGKKLRTWYFFLKFDPIFLRGMHSYANVHVCGLRTRRSKYSKSTCTLKIEETFLLHNGNIS